VSAFQDPIHTPGVIANLERTRDARSGLRGAYSEPHETITRLNPTEYRVAGDGAGEKFSVCSGCRDWNRM
jgi:hypothetical protein